MARPSSSLVLMMSVLSVTACRSSSTTSGAARAELRGGEGSAAEGETGAFTTLDEDDDDNWSVIDFDPAQVFGEQGGPFSVVGESEVEWLPEDRLWVDGLLVIPERREVMELGGSRVLSL